MIMFRGDRKKRRKGDGRGGEGEKGRGVRREV
jgi:hypothetical protein